MIYEKNPIGHLVKTNPIQTQFAKRVKLMQSVYLQKNMKKMRLRALKKQSQNKPKTNPIYSKVKLHMENNSLPCDQKGYNLPINPAFLAYRSNGSKCKVTEIYRYLLKG